MLFIVHSQMHAQLVIARLAGYFLSIYEALGNFTPLSGIFLLESVF